ncbi:hypothetical protein AB0B01_15970 [Streptomyces sp. NPDC044571]|uniref:hypothetical protein n=1 Tax=Streptomyces sp. NPDC044571 TaxID=3155371 RepID=UPI0033CC0AC6
MEEMLCTHTPGRHSRTDGPSGQRAPALARTEQSPTAVRGEGAAYAGPGERH